MLSSALLIIGAFLGADTSEIEAKAKAAYLTAAESQYDEELAMRQRVLAHHSGHLTTAKNGKVIPGRHLLDPKTGIQYFPDARTKARIVAERQAEVDAARDDVDALEKVARIPAMVYINDVKLHAAGLLAYPHNAYDGGHSLYKQPVTLTVDYVIDKQNIEVTAWEKTFCLRVDSTGIVDDQEITVRKPIYVAGTAKIGGRTMFLLIPFDAPPLDAK